MTFAILDGLQCVARGDADTAAETMDAINRTWAWAVQTQRVHRLCIIRRDLRVSQRWAIDPDGSIVSLPVPPDVHGNG